MKRNWHLGKALLILALLLAVLCMGAVALADEGGTTT